MAGKEEGGSRSRRRRQGGLLGLRRRTKSTSGAIALAGLTVVFILLSYRTGSVLFQFDSIVSFIAAVVLLFRDTTHTVQARVVNRMLTSSRQLIADLSAYGLGGSSFLYVPEGRRVADVMLVPVKGSVSVGPDPATASRKEAAGDREDPKTSSPPPPSRIETISLAAPVRKDAAGDLKNTQGDNGGPGPEETRGDKAETAAISNLKFPPPGRAMAEIFLRESALADPTMDSVIAAIPETIASGFQIASSASVSLDSASGDSLKVILVHPVLPNGCSHRGAEGAGIVGCEICSMLAVLFSSTTGRIVTLQGCTYDEEGDTSTASLHLEAKYRPD